MGTPTTKQEPIPNNLHQPKKTHEQAELELLFAILQELKQLNERLLPLEKLTKSKLFMRRFAKEVDEEP